jgi:hypothetical protein
VNYDYTEVRSVRFDRAAKKVEVVAKGHVHTIEGVERVTLKSVPFFDDKGVAHLNRGRVSVSPDGKEVVAGD